MRSPLSVRPSVPAKPCCPSCRRPLGGRPRLARPVPVLTLEQLRDVAAGSGRVVETGAAVVDVGDNHQVRATVTIAVRFGPEVERFVGEAVLDEDFQRTDVWHDDPVGALCGVAEARAIRAAFPGRLRGTVTVWEVGEAEPVASRGGRAA